MRRTTLVLWIMLVGLAATVPARADQPTQQDVFKSIQDNVNGADAISTKTLVGCGAVVVGLTIIFTKRQEREERTDVINGGWGSAGLPRTVPAGVGRKSGVVNSPSKLVRELMKEAGLTRAQVRQLESLNERLAADDRSVQHLATLLLCPSLISSAKPEQILRAA
jgi:hypothetical protein